MTLPPFGLHDPAADAHQLHSQVEVLDRHAVNLPDRVARLPKELESRESQIPYDYDLSVQDPQDRVVPNNVVELDVRILSAIQSPPISFLGRHSRGEGRLQKENDTDETHRRSQAQHATSQNGNREKGTAGSREGQDRPIAVAAACCGGQLKLEPPSRSPAHDRPCVSAARHDVVRIEQVDLSISRENPRDQRHH